MSGTRATVTRAATRATVTRAVVPRSTAKGAKSHARGLKNRAIVKARRALPGAL